MTPAQLRAQLPLLKSTTWLNAASSSPCPQPVYEAMNAFLRDTVEHGDTHHLEWFRFKKEVRSRLARFIGATPTEIAFTPNTSFGFHIIAQMLKAKGITEVLTLETEFPSTTLPLLHDGLTLRGVRLRSDGTYALNELEAALTPRTGAIAVSAVQYASGFRIDLEAVSALCRARGLTFIVNAAQGIGHVPLDVHRLGVHFLAATSHKWLMAGYGTAMLFVQQSWLDEVRLPMGGWLSVSHEHQFQTWAHAQRVDDATGFTAQGTRFRSDAPALEAGSGPLVGMYAIDAALALHEAVTPAVTLAHNIALQLNLRGRLRKAGFTPNMPDDPKSLSGICVVPVAGSAQDVVRALFDEASISTTARGVGLRISTHVFNDESDIDRLMFAIEKLGIKPPGA